jgi:2-polyprenyl-3-methyl-5-hydroxy-6-metoxy-1,4-benzoquinol methylase
LDYIETKLEEVNGIYTLNNKASFGYSDGSRNEQYIAKVIESSSDISSNSTELESKINGWVSKYHLSMDRVNAYRDVKFSDTDVVLEVGAGCGSITRFLAEKVKHVVAVEGSHVRAGIIKSRVRDLENVTVVCSPFQDLQYKTKFDYIVCNGVYEYSGSFVNEKDPYDYILKLFRGLLSDDGVLIIAIENKFGLKYFTSSREDHTNIMFDGIEGYCHHPNKVETFGIVELVSKIKKEFKFIDTLIPLPDYKFPKALISEKMINTVNTQALFSSFVASDYITYTPPLFNEKIVYQELSKNDMLIPFSNSFMLFSSNKNMNCFESDWLGSVYKTGRKAENMSVSKFINTETVIVKKEAFGQSISDDSMLNLDQENWADGDSIHNLILRSLCNKDFNNYKSLFNPIFLWWNSVLIFKDVELEAGNSTTVMTDFIWRNSIVNNNDVIYIDKEWIVDGVISLDFLLFRSVYTFFMSESKYYKDWNKLARRKNIFRVSRVIFELIGMKFSVKKMYQYLSMEYMFELKTTGRVRNSPLINFFVCFIGFGTISKIQFLKRYVFLKKDSLNNFIEKLMPN